MHARPGLPAFIAVLLAFVQPKAADDLSITPRMHHLRSGAEREWAEFPARAEASELTIAFDGKANGHEQTLRLRHRDLKQEWRVLANGKRVAALPPDEADMFTYWPLPAGALKDGSNELRIRCAGGASDDVLIGQVTLIDRRRDEVLSEASVDVTVHQASAGGPTPARITVTDGRGTLVSLGNVSGPREAVRPGVVYSIGGLIRLKLPAGRYVLYAGRGFEYSVARAAVDLAPGANPPQRLTIRREVDTSGWVAMDTHVHTGTFARHGDASLAERMLTIAGEGIELPVSTEHNTRVDFDPAARAANVRRHFTPVVGTEVTTPSLGHFNVFPIPPTADEINHKAADWMALRASLAAAAADPMIVLNHGRDVHGGFRPLDPARHASPAAEDLELRSLPANAMEVVNSGAVMSDPMTLPRDWMGLLNRGMMLTPVGSSDSHDVSRYIVGQGRTYVRGDDRNPERLDVVALMERARRGQVMVSYGLLAELDVNGRGPGELVHSDGGLDVRIRVSGPAWTRATRVALYVNGAEVRREAINASSTPGLKWQGRWRLPKPPHDVHLVAIATGPGVSEPYWPMAKPYQPASIEFTPYVLGLSGAVLVDADRNGTFERK